MLDSQFSSKDRVVYKIHGGPMAGRANFQTCSFQCIRPGELWQCNWLEGRKPTSRELSLVTVTDESIHTCRDGQYHLTRLRYPQETNNDASRFLQRYGCPVTQIFFPLNRPTRPDADKGELNEKATGRIQKRRTGTRGIQLISRGGAVWRGLASRRTGTCFRNRLISWKPLGVKGTWSRLNRRGLLCRGVRVFKGALM